MFAKLKTSEVMYVPREENSRAVVVSRLESTRGFGVTHSFIQETLKMSSIETLENYVMVIGGFGNPRGYLPP